MLEAPAATDRFVDPVTGTVRDDSPIWLTGTGAPASLRARVSATFADTFDAGVLMAYQARDRWAKLCFERAPDGRVMVVTVVTRGRSDDANAFVVDGADVWLRISVLAAGAYAFHASRNGEAWDLVRLFSLGERGRRRVGLSSQSPVGGGCTATFSEISLVPEVPVDLRSGV